MSFNYYANTRLYDNRADRVERKWSDKTNGAIEHGEITENDIYKTSEEKKGVYNMNVGGSVGSTNTSSFYSTKMYKYWGTILIDIKGLELMVGFV